MAVLIGIAKAVRFLHTGVIPGFLKNRLKTNNILLDNHRIAKLSDYGLSIITEEIDKHEVGICVHWDVLQLVMSLYVLTELLF